MLAGLLTTRGQTCEAIYHYELAAHYRPGDSAILLGLARAYADAAQLDDAERMLDDLLSAEPDSTDALVERGRLTLRRGRLADAEPFLKRAVDLAPWHRDAQRLYLIALKETGQTEPAQKCEARLAELKSEDAEGGRLKLRARDMPGDVTVRWEMWLWCARNGQLKEGISWLMKTVRIEPPHPQAQAALADYFETAGQPRRAALHRALAGEWQQKKPKDEVHR
jgi:tetratricopeptide (TPR) repeat protein